MADPTVRVVIGKRFYDLTPDQAGRVESVLAGGKGGGPYVFAEVGVCHSHGCRSTLSSKRVGPCNCGGDQLLREVLARG